ncbi:MAG: polysaccharide deacetylase family protein [Deltaproteobacteria bacterium]|nr:polysaccharide deacetylase family protein [Deltaproteobacteria bacterium]
MNFSIYAKRVVSYPLSGILRATGRFGKRPSILILMYHRVLNIRALRGLIQEGMYVDVETFGKHVRFLKRHYEIVPLEACLEIMQKKEFAKRPFCCITFDDGWKDFHDHAFPVLKNHDAVATVFLPTAFIGTDRLFWTDKLGRILTELNGKGSVRGLADLSEPMIEKICDLSGSPMERFEEAIRMLKALPARRIDDINDILCRRLGISIDGSERSFLSWEEVRAMRERGVVRFGSHTRNHVILTTVDEQTISEELAESKSALLEKGAVSESFIPFSYPNGDHTDRIADLVKSAGYTMALTTKKGWNRYVDGPVDLFRLERVGIHQDMSSTDSMFSCRINGIY